MARLIQEIKSRRAAQFLREYDFMDADETPQQQHKRFKWLHSEGALSDEDFKKRVGMIEAAATPITAMDPPESNRLLN